MKVEQREIVVYAPITITLETQEEADIMYAVLNCPKTQSLLHSQGGKFGLVISKHFHTHQEMFESFDAIYLE